MELETIESKLVSTEDDDINQSKESEYKNLNDSIDAPPEILYHSRSNQTQSKNILIQKMRNTYELFSKYPQKIQACIMLGGIIALMSLLSKIYILVSFWKSLIIEFHHLYELISFYLHESFWALPLYHLNNIFLGVGILIFTSQPFIEFMVKMKFFFKPFDTPMIILIINKIWFFISLGLVPEISMTMFQFHNMRNFILPFFIAKICLQPFLFISLIIYGLVILGRFTGRDRWEKIKKHFSIYKRVFLLIINSNALLWNNFRTESTAIGTNSLRKSAKSSTSSSDDNLISNPIIQIKKRHIAFIILFSILLCPILNGIFGYGYYIFSFKDELACFLFKLDIFYSVILGVIIVKINEFNHK